MAKGKYAKKGSGKGGLVLLLIITMLVVGGCVGGILVALNKDTPAPDTTPSTDFVGLPEETEESATPEIDATTAPSTEATTAPTEATTVPTVPESLPMAVRALPEADPAVSGTKIRSKNLVTFIPPQSFMISCYYTIPKKDSPVFFDFSSRRCPHKKAGAYKLLPLSQTLR